MNIKMIAAGAALFFVGVGVGASSQPDSETKQDGKVTAASGAGTQQKLVETTVTTAAPTTTTQPPTTTTTLPPTTTTIQAPKWTAVASLSGAATKQSPSFAIRSEEQRLTYTCRGSGGGGCIFAVNEGSYPAFHTSPDHAGADTTSMHLDPGTYHLEVDIIGDWTFTVKVEELR